jgi:hypothetical protein
MNLVVFELLGLNTPYSRPTEADFNHIGRHCRKQIFRHCIIEDNTINDINELFDKLVKLHNLLPPLNHTLSLRNSLNYYVKRVDSTILL